MIAPMGASAGELIGVRLGERAADETRVVFDIVGDVDYALQATTAGSGRIIVKIAGSPRKEALTSRRRGKGLIGAYASERAAGVARVTIDLARTAKVKEVFVLPPRDGTPHSRLVLDFTAAPAGQLVASIPNKYSDLEAVIQAATSPEAGPETTPQTSAETTQESAAGAAAQAAKTAPPTDRADAASFSREPAGRRREKSAHDGAPSSALPVIVIDAGHGGADPGAAGPSGLKEKGVTLAAAKTLSEMLKAKGRYRIIMTRTDDSRLSAKKRAKLARAAQPDLFISLHADAHPNAKIRGTSVYTLSSEGAERSAREAKSQKDYQVGDLKLSEVEPELGDILYSFAQRETINASDRFAGRLVDALSPVTLLLKNTHRKEDLRVLLAPDVPAVLLELAFISNDKDEKNLNSPAWRKKTMRAVAEAIDSYFEESARFRNAAARAENAG